MEGHTPWEARSSADHAPPRGQIPATPRSVNGNGHHAVNGHARQPSGGSARSTGAEVYPLREAGGVEVSSEVELVIFRFMSFGRLAHFRRSLLSMPNVVSARIRGYGDQTAYFTLAVNPGTRAAALAVPGTRLLTASGARVELCVEGW